MLENFGFGDASAIVFVAGFASGAVLSAAVLSRKRTKPAALARRLDRVELVLAAARFKESEAVLRTAQLASDALQGSASETLAAAMTPARRPTFWARDLADPRQMLDDLAKSLTANAQSAVAIGQAIGGGADLNDGNVRKSVAREVKAASQGLDTSFWDRHAGDVKATELPEVLKGLFAKFYAQVKTLKAAVVALAGEPTAGALIVVLEHAADLLKTGASIVDEVQKISGAGA